MQTLEIRHFATLTIRTDPDGLYMLGPTSAGKRIIQELLESGDELYAFVNGLRLVSKGAVGDGGNVAHEIFELI